MAQTFSLASGGGFQLRGTVTTWLTSPMTRQALSGRGTVTISGSSDFVWYALQSVDQSIDFGEFDNDGPDGIPNSGDDDGVVDGGVVILHPERNIYCDPTGRGTHPYSVPKWRPKGALFATQDAARAGGAISIGGYVLMSVTGCSATTVQSSVLAHELGHLLFWLPDLYRGAPGAGPVWSTRRWTVGCWELMAAGSWGCNTGAPPPVVPSSGLGAWSRTLAGWVTPTVIDATRDSTYDLYSEGHGGTVLRVPVSFDEYLLLEYRERTAGDAVIPADGILIHDIADSRPTDLGSGGVANRVRLIEADDDSGLVRSELEGGDRGVPGDAFGTTRTSLRPGEHSQAVSVTGLPLPFEITNMTIDRAHHRARVRISPIAAASRQRR